MFDNNVPELEHGDVAPVTQPQMGIGIDVDLLELDPEGAQLGRHLVAEMAAVPAVQLSPCQ